MYFASRGNENAAPFAVLDVDDTTGLGPETITVDPRAQGTCTYAVHNYSGEPSITTSGARVQVYRGDALVQSFTPPAGDGQWWTVFSFPCGSGALAPVNSLSNNEPVAPPGPGPQPSPTTPPSASAGNITGQVRHATQAGQFIAGATVTAGGISVTTGADGRFTLTNVPAGQVTLRVNASGFIEATQAVTVPPGGLVDNVIIALSPALAAGQTRIVLTWGSSPRDLDSYLYSPTGGPIYYGTRTGTGANLDVDDTTGFGPETITITAPSSGTYLYAVNQYSTDGALPSNGAVVRVFRGTQEVASYPVPAGSGRWWHVFSIDGATGTITPINQIRTTPPR